MWGPYRACGVGYRVKVEIPVIVNLQRKIQFDTRPLRDFVESLQKEVADANRAEFSVALVSDRRMKELNNLFRGKNSTTDVLSFPHEPDEFVQSTHFSASEAERAEAPILNEDFLGDIVISVEQAARQSMENGLTLENEIKQLILHGLLHLCGYDHETDKGEMNARELVLREQLGI